MTEFDIENYLRERSKTEERKRRRVHVAKEWVLSIVSFATFFVSLFFLFELEDRFLSEFIDRYPSILVPVFILLFLIISAFLSYFVFKLLLRLLFKQNI